MILVLKWPMFLMQFEKIRFDIGNNFKIKKK